MKFLKKLFVYAFGNGLSKLISIIILPIYTNYLLPVEYGQADLVYYTVSIVVSFVFMEVWTALLRFVFDDYQENNLKRVFTNVLIIALVLVIPFLVIEYCISFTFSTTLAFFACLYGVSYLFLQIAQMFVRAKGDSKIFVTSGVINSIVQLIVAYFGIVRWNLGSKIMLIGPFLGCLIALLYIEWKAHPTRYICFKLYDIPFIKKIIKFSFPLAFNSVAFWAMNNINRYFAAHFLGYEASSYVAIAAKLTMVITLASSIYSLAWQESAFERSNEKNRGHYYSKMFLIYFALFSIATAGFIIVVKFFFPYLIGKNYYDSLAILPPYFIAVFFSGLSSFFGQLFSAEKRTTTLLYSTVLGAIVNVAFVLILIRPFGIAAIPFGSLSGYLICCISRFYKIRKIVNMKIEISYVVSSVLLLSVSILLFYYVNSFGTFIIALLVFGILAIVCYRTLILEMFQMLKKKGLKNE